MTKEPQEAFPFQTPPAAWVFYDDTCAFCRRARRLGERLIQPDRVRWLPQQDPWARQHLGLSTEGQQLETAGEIKVMRADNGQILGGAEGLATLARFTWWGWPAYWLYHIPCLKYLADSVYKLMAKNRHRIGGHCRLDETGAATCTLPGHSPH
ncbi:MAG: DUF393 domain-containing protein [Cyanobacteria bacterium HKST-UBA05]|nr:DUF393 domain-containing protein [Cyanobacteria bacterium HKST-UBA05]